MPCVLSPEPWFLNVLGDDVSSLAENAYAQFYIVGLVRVVPGAVRHILHHWPKEADLLWRYYHQPLDGYTVQIVDRFVASPRRQVFLTKRIKRTGGHTVTMGDSCAITLRGDNGVFECADDLQDMSFQDGAELSSIGSLAEKFGTPGVVPQVLLVPEPICNLVFLGKWQHLLLLARWPLLPSWEWPASEWVNMMKGSHGHVILDGQWFRVRSLFGGVRWTGTRCAKWL
jgi:hypothetical protein